MLNQCSSLRAARPGRCSLPGQRLASIRLSPSAHPSRLSGSYLLVGRIVYLSLSCSGIADDGTLRSGPGGSALLIAHVSGSSRTGHGSEFHSASQQGRLEEWGLHEANRSERKKELSVSRFMLCPTAPLSTLTSVCSAAREFIQRGQRQQTRLSTIDERSPQQLNAERTSSTRLTSRPNQVNFARRQRGVSMNCTSRAQMLPCHLSL
jgi:hypothetical protein